MDSLDNILTDRTPHEPPQVAAIKKFVSDNYGTNVAVIVSPKFYLINAPNASIAHRLRVDTVKMISVCNLDKRLVIHIGN